MTTVELKNLTRVYDKNVRAVEDVSIRVEDGSFVVLVGPSGCGKTTILNLIAGIDEPTSGEVFIGDRRVNGEEPMDRDIAMVFQNYALYPHMNVRDNIGYGLRVQGVPKKERYARVERIAALLDIEPLLLRKPSQLSGGQKQRVALGRAIIRQPKVFLFDEPLSNLDAALRAAMRDELIRLHERIKATFIYVTHDQIGAMTMGSQIVVMKDGRCQQCATPQEIYERPANQFVAAFLGAPRMNFLPSLLVGDGMVILESEMPEVALDAANGEMRRVTACAPATSPCVPAKAPIFALSWSTQSIWETNCCCIAGSDGIC